MELILESNDMSNFLERSEFINYDDYKIISISNMLAEKSSNEIDLIKNVYEYVRDEIHHTMDIEQNEIVSTAAQVLEKQHGICLAKAFLLAAMLRYLKIPTGLCYQKVWYFRHFLHGLNAVYIKQIDKWIRLDARGNKPGVNAQFDIEKEKVCYKPKKFLGELNYPTVYYKPPQTVIETFTAEQDFKDFMKNLPKGL